MPEAVQVGAEKPGDGLRVAESLEAEQGLVGGDAREIHPVGVALVGDHDGLRGDPGPEPVFELYRLRHLCGLGEFGADSVGLAERVEEEVEVAHLEAGFRQPIADARRDAAPGVPDIKVDLVDGATLQLLDGQLDREHEIGPAVAAERCGDRHKRADGAVQGTGVEAPAQPGVIVEIEFPAQPAVGVLEPPDGAERTVGADERVADLQHLRRQPGDGEGVI